MSFFVGIDIGAVSAKAALVTDDPSLQPERTGVFSPLVEAPASTGRRIFLSPYRRTRGQPLAAATQLLDEMIAAVGAENIAGVCLTGGAARLAADALAASVVNEFRALASGLAALPLGPLSGGCSVRTVFEMGGESSKYLRLAPNADGGYGIVDYATNGDCAAGTGSFLDQQAGRLRYAVEEIGTLCLQAERAAQIAGRCSVFAKSDMIHAQQKGYSPAEVLRGLCDAVARNFRTAVVRSHPVEAPVVLVGGLAANAAVVTSLREAFELDEQQLRVPPAFAHVAAIGAAMEACRGRNAADLSHMHRLRQASDFSHGDFPTSAPLGMTNVVLLRDRVEPAELGYGESVDAYLGIDIGSVSTNVVLLDDEGRMLKEIYTRTQGRPIEVVTEALAEVEAELGERIRILGVGTTGSGRELIGELVGADTINDEITCHKTGAMFVGRTMLDGRVPDTIFEIGGQDSKFISLQDGVVVDFTMNEACAAGTGSFLEERAEELDIAIKGEFAELALSSRAPIRLGERCTVFMERDVNSYMQRGASKADLVAGLAYSVVYNYINRVVRGRKIGDCIFFQGGTAYNDAVAAAFAAVTGKEIVVPPYNGVIGAIGAALLARDKMLSQPASARPARTAGVEGGNGDGKGKDDGNGDGNGNGQRRLLGTYVSDMHQAADAARRGTRFRGYDLSKVEYRLREFTCHGCSNACQIQEFNVEGEKTYWGDKCSDRYRKRKTSGRKPVIEDLLALRQRLLLDESGLDDVGASARTVGIPLTMFAVEQLPFWRTLLNRCGFAVMLSDPSNKKIVQAGLDAVVAEPCFPIIAAHGHVANIAAKGVDYILMPNVISMETRWMHCESHLCPWHQTMPFVCRQAPALAHCAERFLTPTVRFRDGQKAVFEALKRFFKPLGVRPATLQAALDAAYEAQTNFQANIHAAGKRALGRLSETREAGIVLVGRPYNTHDAGMNLSVGYKLRETYGVNVLPMDFLDLNTVDIRDVNPNMFWNLGRRIISAAKIVARHDNLHILYITNFKCGPDSFIKHFIRRSSGKPFLTLQFDGHSNDAGMMTRCEAYLDSKGILRPWRREELAATTH